MDWLKIFVSGTQDDMQPERQAVAGAICALGHEPVMAETYGAQPMSSLSAIREMVDRADIYIGVYGARYGWKVDSGISVTEFEFMEFRRKHPDRILTYVKKCTPEANQATFLNRVQDFKEGYFRRPFFTDTTELAEWVKEDLAQFIANVVHEKMRGAPNATLIKAYLEQVAANKPYVLWSDQTYIDRTVAKTEDLFARTVARYDPRETRKEKTELLEEALAREKKLVLLGEPGMGKTTGLLHLAWQATQQNSGEIPIYVELKYYNGEPELETLLARRVNELLNKAERQPLSFDLDESTRILKKWLAQSDARFLLLLDGLNEVRPEFQIAIHGALTALLHTVHRIVISCREHDYDASLRDRASAFILQGLQENEIRDYLKRILSEKGISIFEEQIRFDGKMLTLAANPLMLWLISVVAQGSSDARLPANRGKLFRQFISRMPRLRASEGVRVEISPDVIAVALARLGFEMQERGQLTADLGEVREWQIPTAGKTLEDVLTQAKDWRFLKSDGRLGEQIEFIHQLFLEYFAATHLNMELHKEPDYERILGNRPFGSRWAKGSWYEVVLILMGISDSPAKLITWVAAKSIERKDEDAANLAYECLKTIGAVENNEARKAVVEALISVLRNSSGYACQRAAESLGEIGDFGAVDPLIDEFRKHRDSDLGVSCAYALGKLGDVRAVDALTEALHDNEMGDYLRGWVLQAFGRILSKHKVTTKGELYEH